MDLIRRPRKDSQYYFEELMAYSRIIAIYVPHAKGCSLYEIGYGRKIFSYDKNYKNSLKYLKNYMKMVHTQFNKLLKAKFSKKVKGL